LERDRPRTSDPARARERIDARLDAMRERMDVEGDPTPEQIAVTVARMAEYRRDLQHRIERRG